MAKGRELKGRIKTVENTRKITRTMEMVATSKMKRAQDRVADCMQQHVGVGVTGETAIVRNHDTADHERSTVGECMSVDPAPDTNVHRWIARIAAASARSSA